MAWEEESLREVKYTKDHSFTILCKVRGSFSGQMGDYSSEHSKVGTKMDKALSFGQMGKFLKANSKMTNVTVKVSFTILMENVLKVCGRWVKSTVLVFTIGRTVPATM